MAWLKLAVGGTGHCRGQQSAPSCLRGAHNDLYGIAVVIRDVDNP